MTRLLALLLFITLAHAATIGIDDGGMLSTYAQSTLRYYRTGELVRFTGLCASACTLYLMSENVCITKQARFAFHAPRRAGKHKREMQERMMGLYLREWIEARGGLSSRWLEMSYSYARKFMAECP